MGGPVVVGWGSNGEGQLGSTTSEVTPRPRALPGLPDELRPTACAAGLWNSLVVGELASEGICVYATSPGPRVAPKKMELPSEVRGIAAVACGRDFALVLSGNGLVATMGSGAYGQLGHGKDLSSLENFCVINSLSHTRIIGVAGAEFHWLALDSLGIVYACGGNAFGQLGLGHTDNVSTPTVVSALWPHPVVGIATGDNHSAVLTSLGTVLCFGSNKLGQLGQPLFAVKVLSLTPIVVKVPQSGNRGFAGGRTSSTCVDDGDLEMVDVNMERKNVDRSPADGDRNEGENDCGAPMVFVDIACGQSHTVALRSDGSIVCWGNGQNGQLGSRATRTLYTPTVVHSDQKYVSVSAGALHSAAVTSEGVAYLWGDGSLGQIGDGHISDKMLPVPLSQPKPFINVPGSELDLAEVEAPFRFLSIECGGYHNIGFVSNDESQPVTVAANLWRDRIPVCRVDQMLSAKAGLSRFGSAAVLLRTFTFPWGASKLPLRIDYESVESAYTSFLSMFGGDGEQILGRAAARLRHEAQIAFGIAKDDGKVFSKLDESSSLVTPRAMFSMSDDAFRPSVANKEECGAIFLIAMMNPVYSAKDREPELAELAALLQRVEDEGREVFLNLAGDCPTHLIVTRLIRPLQGVLSDELRGYRRITKNAIFATKALAFLYHAVLRGSQEDGERSLKVPRQEFYNDTVSELVDPKEDYDRWLQSNESNSALPPAEPPLPKANSSERRFSFCDYSFLLSEAAKFRILGVESGRTMNKESRRSVMTLGALPISLGPWGLAPTLRLHTQDVLQLQFLVLNIRRENIVSDAFDEIAKYLRNQPRELHELHKPLRVIFDGEDGVDEGGVAKEFYQVLLQYILSPDYGMFAYDEETRYHWFRREFMEPVESWTMIGIIFGLAAFNSILLDVQFPLVVYRKLQGVFKRNLRLIRERKGWEGLEGESDYKPTLADVQEAFPSVGESLLRLLEYEGDDVEDVFCLTYQISYAGLFGKVETHDLIPNGDSVPVTNKNRKDFVERYVKFLIDDSIAVAFKHFAIGFCLMLNGPFVHQFRAEELETLVVGEKELDFEAMRQTTKYEGFSESSKVIEHLWQVLSEFDLEERQLFLSFVTGTDRAPIGGLRQLGLVVQRSGGDSNRLPTSHTCFNVLLLPEYATRAKLRDRLTTAIRNSQGFGLR